MPTNADLQYEWLAPKLSSSEREALDRVYDELKVLRDQATVLKKPMIVKPPKTAQDTYWVALDPEDMSTLQGPYATRAYAIKAGPKALGLEKGQTFWSGRAECSAVREVLKLAGFADLLLEHVEGELETLLGDTIEGWLEKITPGEKVELEDRLSAALLIWLVKTGHYPPFFVFESEEKHDAP